jgi:uncharacterized protein (DUF58 family)
METSELLKKVRSIEIKMKGLSKQIFSGEYHSAFKGRGMSFSEVRNYQYGDDVRNIDWNVTARTGDPHVKIFEEERELTVMLLIDMSRSAYFGAVNQFKSDTITEICALLSFSAINNNDKVGVIFFTNQVELFIPPQKGRQHILRIIRELLNFETKGKGTNLGTTLKYFNNVIKKRSICFILSDFFTQGYEDDLKIATRRHDVIGMQVTDPGEANLPNMGLVRVQDAETGELQWLDTSAEAIQMAYAKGYQNNLQQFRSTFIRSGADVISIQTTDSYTSSLHQFFQKRSAR